MDRLDKKRDEHLEGVTEVGFYKYVAKDAWNAAVKEMEPLREALGKAMCSCVLAGRNGHKLWCQLTMAEKALTQVYGDLNE